MAVSKLWVVRQKLSQVINYVANKEKTDSKLFTDKDFSSLKDVLSYAKNETKTDYEYYCDGINCNVNIAREQFITVKEQFGKTDGIQAYHGYLSFNQNELTPQLCQTIGMEFAKRMWGDKFQVVVTTHLNTAHLHCHFVINSVSFIDGKRLQGNQKRWFYFRHIADAICKEYNLSTVKEPNLSKDSRYLTMKELAGMPTRYSIVKESIDDALCHCTNINQFKYALSQMGYTYQFSSNRKYWTITPKGYKKPIRLKNLGEQYTNEAILNRLKENSLKWNEIKPFKQQTVVFRQYKLQTRKDKIKKVGGIYGIYLYYCYKLGKLPKYKNQKNSRLHYLLKEELLNIEKISDEVRLMGREKISTLHQLFSYKEKVILQINTLILQRDDLRIKARKKVSENELSQIKSEISKISEELKFLRNEVVMCDRIEKRSDVIKENLNIIETEEQKQKLKEDKIR